MVFLLAVALVSCRGGEPSPASLEDAPILHAAIEGLSAGRVTQETEGDRASITKLYEVAGSWEAASVELAKAVRVHGWQIESINCVGTGNDVIAKRKVNGTWILLESGAGTRGAGIILSVAAGQNPPAPFSVSGSCSPSLLESAGSG